MTARLFPAQPLGTVPSSILGRAIGADEHDLHGGKTAWCQSCSDSSKAATEDSRCRHGKAIRARCVREDVQTQGDQYVESSNSAQPRELAL